MPGSRHKILSHVFSGFSAKMGRTKVLDVGAQATETPLKRCLTTFDITLLGKKQHREPNRFWCRAYFETKYETSGVYFKEFSLGDDVTKKMFTRIININNADKIIAAATDHACYYYLLYSSMVTRVFHSR